MISAHFQNKLFNITVIQIYAPTTNAENGEGEQFYEDLQELLEHQKRCLFHHSDWNPKVGSQKTPGVNTQVWP